MASLEPVAAGFMVVPSRDRERQYLIWLRDRGEAAVPLEGALFDIRLTREGQYVVLLPFRSYEAARRVRKLFERACRDHQRAAKNREQIKALDP